MIACQSNAGLYLDKITDQGSGRNVGGGEQTKPILGTSHCSQLSKTAYGLSCYISWYTTHKGGVNSVWLTVSRIFFLGGGLLPLRGC